MVAEVEEEVGVAVVAAVGVAVEVGEVGDGAGAGAFPLVAAGGKMVDAGVATSEEPQLSPAPLAGLEAGVGFGRRPFCIGLPARAPDSAGASAAKLRRVNFKRLDPVPREKVLRHHFTSRCFVHHCQSDRSALRVERHLVQLIERAVELLRIDLPSSHPALDQTAFLPPGGTVRAYSNGGSTSITSRFGRA